MGLVVFKYHNHNLNVTPSLYMALDGLIILDKAGFVGPPRVIILKY